MGSGTGRMGFTGFNLLLTTLGMAWHHCDRYIFENVGKKRIMTITKTTLADDAAYECCAGDEKSFTEVFVRGE